MDFGTTKIDADGLKIIAYTTMFIDHFFAIFYAKYMMSDMYHGVYTGRFDDDIIYTCGRAIGRISFILFAFMISQGMIYSHNKYKYLLRLLILSIISEPFYDIAYRGRVTFGNISSSQNVVITLFLGALAIYLLTYFENNKVMQIMSILACMLLAYLLHSDYGWGGVLAIVILYFFRSEFFIAFFGAVVVISIACIPSETEWLAALAIIPLSIYSGQRKNIIPRWLCYIYYPIHLVTIKLLADIFIK